MSNKDIRDAFFDEIYDLASKDKNIIFISADADAFSLKKFKENLPDQFINIGVAEQNMVLLATGLAMMGKKVFIYCLTPFISYRCFEQIKVNICSMNLPVTIIGTGSGFSFEYDGPTHHATQDIAIMRTLPELNIFNPIDSSSAQYTAQKCYYSNQPNYVRIDKGLYNQIYSELDCNNFLYESSNNSKIKIISTGTLTHDCLVVKSQLEKLNIIIDVIDIFLLKPLPNKLLQILKNSSLIFSVEENVLTGGLGSMLCETIIDNSLSVKLKRFALKNEQLFAYGKRKYLLKKNNLDIESLCKSIMLELP